MRTSLGSPYFEYTSALACVYPYTEIYLLASSELINGIRNGFEARGVVALVFSARAAPLLQEGFTVEVRNTARENMLYIMIIEQLIDTEKKEKTL